ncbi:MAG: Nramp family divalent metal transporter, partial [Planctomycetes bacterium]|nr:Nramp family divalent metal transporter [Planctomycetota bacterium]
MTQPRSILRRIGPAFIVGACIIGPGSVTIMSTTGAHYGYSMLWLSLASGVLMAGFLAVFMRFGIYSDETFLGLTARKLGRWFAVLCGISLFSVDATFQFGNALGVKAGMNALFPDVWPYTWPIAFTAAAIVFLFSFKSIYGIIEKMMTFFLVFMAAAFFITLVWAKPDMAAVAQGALVPSIPDGADWVVLGGLVATTFVIVAAFLQPYLVKAKGWTEKDLGNGLIDTLLASLVLTLIGAMIMMTAAAVLHGRDVSGTINFPVMISQLEKAFGDYARVIFSIGFFSAAFSSFITNSLIGGVLLNDGLGLGGKLESLSTKICATLVLLTGMSTALYIIHIEATSGVNLTVKAIRIGQAATMLAVPLGVIAMVVVLFDSKAVKGRGLPMWAKGFVLFGAALLLGIAALMYVKIQPELTSLLGLSDQPAESTSEAEAPAAHGTPAGRDPQEAPGPVAESPKYSAEQLAAAETLATELKAKITKDADGNITAIDMAAGRSWANDDQMRTILVFEQLTALTLEGPDITDALAPRIAELTGLTSLAMRNTQIGDQGIAQLTGLKALRVIDLRAAPRVSDAAMQSLVALPELRAVRLIGGNVTDAGVETLLALPRLTELDVRNCRGVTGKGIGLLAAKKSLRVLKLGGSAIDDDSLALV